MSRRLDDLSPEMRRRACDALARMLERGVPVLIVDTLRTEEEHRANLANGTSSIALSFHLPRRLRVPAKYPAGHPEAESSDAIDVVPYQQFVLHGANKAQWQSDDPAWSIVGECFEAAGLEWGGRWRKPHDPGHGQLPRKEWDR